MNMKQFFFVSLVGVAFAACSKDAAHENGNFIEGERFMAVKLVMSGDVASTRAFGSSGFEAGTEAEVGVTKATFLFFDGEHQVADPFTTGTLDPWNNGTAESVDKVSSPVIVLSNAIKNPTSIVAILNPTQEVTNALTRNTTLTQLKAIHHDYSKNTTEKNFVMSNSVYVKDGKQVIGTPCTPDNIKKTQDEAKQNPVKIAVEKVVAKVKVSQAEDMKVETNPTAHNKQVNVDGASKEINAEITGWWLDNTNPTSYLIKKVETTYGTSIGDTWWNDEPNRRSYWATPATTQSFTHYAYNTAKALTEDRYCLENTNQDSPTQIVVAATLKTAGQAKTLVKYLGTLYTEDGFNEELAKQLGNKYYKQSGGTDTYIKLTKDDLTFTYDASATGKKSYEAKVTITLRSGMNVFTSVDGTTYQGADAEITTDLANLTRTVQYWKDGKTYYYLPIVHNEDITITPSTAAAGHKLYGVIRNHLYKLSIKSINGLGTPVPNPDGPNTPPIIPEKPEDDHSYIAAQIEILKYKVVNQHVDLGL